MTFAARPNLFVGFNSFDATMDFSGTYEAVTSDAGTAYVALNVFRDGTWNINGQDYTGVVNFASGNWALPTLTGGGIPYYYRVVVNSGVATTATPTSWTQGNGNQAIFVYVEAQYISGPLAVPDVEQVNVTVQVSKTASTSDIISQGTATLKATSYGGDIP